VERRGVVKGPLNGAQRAITSGLELTDRVVINGLPNIRAGQVVQATQAAATPPPTPAAK
jgi:hypothetical protein